MDHLWLDLRFAWRSLRRTPGFALTVVVMMALGIGVNSMMYSVLRTILFADLPFPDVDRLVRIELFDKREGGPGSSMSMPDSRDVRDHAKTLTALTVWAETGLYVSSGDMPQRIPATMASEDLLNAIGVQPLLGRWFTAEECQTGNDIVPVVVGHRVWREQLQGDSAALGRTLQVNGRTRTVVGVLPANCRFPEFSEIFVPLATNDTGDVRGAHYLDVVARLAPGATLEQSRAELAQIAAGIEKEFPSTNKDATFRPTLLRESLVSEIRPMLMLLALAVTFVLLIACANVANLLLARSNGRVRELGVRVAMGATRGRIVWQLLTESVLLALAGGVLGVLLGEWGMRLTLSSIPVETPYWMRFELDPRIVAIVLGVSVLSGILFGLAPALHVTSGDLLSPLREGTPGSGDTPARSRMRNTLVVAEVALAVVLLIGSGLMIRSFLRMQDQRNALRSDEVLTASVTLPVALYAENEHRLRFFREFRHSLAALPGVSGVGGVLNLHLGTSNWTVSVERLGIDPPKGPDHPVLSYNVITPGYLQAVGLTLVEGRDVAESDTSSGAFVALLNQSGARKLFPKESALGKQIRVGGMKDLSTVVGIVADVRQSADSREQRGEVLITHAQSPRQTMTWAIRAEGAPAALAPAVRELMRARDPNLPLYNLRTLREHVARAVWDTRLYAQLLSVFSVLALFIAALGIYGVMAYSVGQRTREIGIRMALGAARADVQRLVMGQATRLTLFGVGLGLAAAYGLTRFMAGMLFGVRPDDPPTFVVVTVLLAASAVLAAWLPVARAVRVDPVVALRHE
jgi:putative ABC transport system permease protein